MLNVDGGLENNLCRDDYFSEPLTLEVFRKKLTQVFLLHGHRRSYRKKSMIFRLSDTANEAYYVEKGRARTFQITPEGKEVTFDIWNPGTSFGMVELLLNYPRIRYTETSSDNTTLLVMNKDQMINLVFSDQEICFDMVRIMGFYLLKYQRLVEDLAIRSVQGRVIQLILRLSQERGLKVGESTVIDLPITHDEIAKMVGGSRQNVTVILNGLRDKRILDWEKKRIRILRGSELSSLI